MGGHKWSTLSGHRGGYRFKIELGFRQAVHILGTYAYHFWMLGMKPLRRGGGDQYLHRTTDEYRAAIRRKLRAYHVSARLYRSEPVTALGDQSHCAGLALLSQLVAYHEPGHAAL